jgi:DNA topoisomerase VI subunit B
VIATAQRLDRTTFQTSRLLDFASEKELVAQTGHNRGEWPLVILKELADNAVDACEEAGIPPQITIRVDCTGITVADNGPGIPETTIEALLDYSQRTSSREAYVSPTRGAQGNALQTILAMPYVLDGTKGRVDISAKGQRHEISFFVDHIRQRPVISRAIRETDVKIGTAIKVWWPFVCTETVIGAEASFLQMTAAYAMLNPHLSLSIDWFGTRTSFEATRTTWPKWTPSEPTPPHWYQPEHLERLLSAYISHDEAGGNDRSIRDVVSEFRGLSATAKQKTVLEEAGLSRQPLSALVNCNGLHHDIVAKLLGSMRKHSKPVKPTMLGVIGREHVEQRFADLDASGTPYVIEVAFAALHEDAGDDRRFIAGVNWSPGIINPFLNLGEGYGNSLDAILADQYAGDDEPVVLLVHLARPRPQFRDRGKATISISRQLGVQIREAVTKATREWAKIRKAEEREAEHRWRRHELLAHKREDKTTINGHVRRDF